MLPEIFNQETLSEEEKRNLADILTSPLIKKYFRIMGQNDLAELAVLSITEKDDSVVAKKHALVQGKLSVIHSILSITKPSKES